MADMGASQIPTGADSEEQADNGARPAAKTEASPSPSLRTIWGIDYIKRQLHERHAKYDAQTPEEKAAWRTANATVWIAAFTIILALVAIFTLIKVIDGGNDTKTIAEAARKQADAAETLANAASDQVKKLDAGVKETHALAKASRDAVALNREALISVQRAFVTFSPTLNVMAVKDETSGQVSSWEFRPTLTNSGTTPTRQARHHATARAQPTPLQDDFSFPDATWSTLNPTVPFVIGPKDSTSGARLPVPPEAIGWVRDHKAHLYFYGWVTYRDVLPSTPLHITMFCLELTEFRIDSRSPTGDVNVLRWTACERHNCTDEDCDGEPYGTPKRIWPN